MSAPVSNQGPSPLAGLKVLDFTRVLAGPYAGRLLSDLGAEVVKIEPPEGDVTRQWGRQVGGIGGYYHQQNAGKRSVCLDLGKDEARAVARRLATRADVVIENFRPDVMPRLGLGHEDLLADNPRLIMLSISGFGQGGPQSHRPAYAPVIHAEAGLVERMVRASPHGKAPDLPWSAADTNAALHGVIAILAALTLRGRTGQGQHIDLAMMDAAVSTDDNLHMELEGAQGLKGLPPEVWRTGAGPILISEDFRLLWPRLARAFGLAEPVGAGDEKIRLRRQAVSDFLAALRSWDEVEAAMARVNLAWGEVRASRDLQRHPTVLARGSIVAVDDRAGGTRPIPQSPYRFSQATSEVRGPAARRGEHNGEVLADWLGMSPTEIAGLAAGGGLLAESGLCVG
jgi:crotonobetainyl-CoA:carnitine CoA-transferase CaiB-like acyl-CoA transferase